MAPFVCDLGQEGPVYAVMANNPQISGLILTKVCFLLMLCIHSWLLGVECCSMLSSSSLWTASRHHSHNLEHCLSPWQRGECSGGSCMALSNALAGSHIQHSCSQSNGQSWLLGPTQCRRTKACHVLKSQRAGNVWRVALAATAVSFSHPYLNGHCLGHVSCLLFWTLCWLCTFDSIK